MWPWGHLGVAYLLYSLYSRGRFGRPPRPAPTMAVVFGALFADLVDKPVAWLGIVPGGRAPAHSLITSAVLLVFVYAAALALDRVATATAFAIAHLSHIVADLPARLFLGYPFDTEFVLWPLLPDRIFGFSERVFEPPAVIELVVAPYTNPAASFTLDLVLFVAAIGLWAVHGFPGVRDGRDRRSRDR